MTDLPILNPGDRVRLRAPHFKLRLRSDLGTVLEPDPRGYDGYYLIRLDEPAQYRESDDSWSDLAEVVEASDNVDVIDKHRTGAIA